MILSDGFLMVIVGVHGVSMVTDHDFKIAASLKLKKHISPDRNYANLTEEMFKFHYSIFESFECHGV